MVILGDINAHHIEWFESVRTDYAGRAVCGFAAPYDLTQFVDGAIRIPDIEGQAPGLLDLLLTSHSDANA